MPSITTFLIYPISCNSQNRVFRPFLKMSLDTGHDFRTARMLMKHYLQNHGTVPPLLENMKKYFCSNCPNVYTTKESFKSHVRHMHSNKPKKYERSKIRFQCPYCEKTYCGSKPLQDHIVLKHEKSPKYHCEICQGNLLRNIDNKTVRREQSSIC